MWPETGGCTACDTKDSKISTLSMKIRELEWECTRLRKLNDQLTVKEMISVDKELQATPTLIYGNAKCITRLRHNRHNRLRRK